MAQQFLLFDRAVCRFVLDLRAGDFRVADVAVGGQGAPLSSIFDFHMSSSESKSVALLNIGGISNVTLLPVTSQSNRRLNVVAFDTGPGNVFMDYITEIITDGAQHFDESGKIAAKGTCNKRLLQLMMELPYFKLKPPKTTGRELFSSDTIKRWRTKAHELGINDVDLLRTVTEFTGSCLKKGAVVCCVYVCSGRMSIGY